MFRACLLRFRPIMMTTRRRCLVRCRWYCRAATARSCGNPTGITIVGGLVMSQLLTLYTTPVVYLFFDRLRLRFSRKPKQTVTE
ncbi:efflux RND transporter permease subunit [Escherichia coli]